ncbi:MAG: FtsX-like permease family protein [Nitrospiraceae bacterium]|nr:FtsX-like permease family protein [Nitrospiraceae bacterium]
MFYEYLKFVVTNLTQRKLRTGLTLIGILVGISAVVALVSLSQGMQNAITTQFEKMGSNRIIITPGGSNSIIESGFSVSKLSENDVKTVKKVLGVESALGVISRVELVTFRGDTERAVLFGVDTDSKTTSLIERTGFFDIDAGRNPKSGETNVAVIGYNVANKKFDKKIKIGNKIIIRGQEFKVIGIQKKVGDGIHDRVIRIPKTALKKLYPDEPGIKDEVSTIFATSSKSDDVNVVADRIKRALRRERNVKKGSEDFNVQTANQVIESFSNILLIVQILLIGVASISLLVGGIVIMNTMYTAVLERVREIGIMKAIGARNLDIMWMFLIESGTLGLLGGLLGLVLGIIISKITEIIAFHLLSSRILVVVYSPILIIFVLFFSFLIGALSGLTPAVQASRLKPVDALRYE